MVFFLIIGFVLAVLLLAMLKWWANAEVKAARNALLWGIVGLCLLFGVVLVAAGKSFLAVLPAGFAAWRMFGSSLKGGQSSGEKTRVTNPGMTRKEALDVLGLTEGATEDDINTAYRKLMAQCHPDKGGNDWMAAKVNDARQTLLGR